MLRWLWDWTPPKRPRLPVIISIEEINVIRTTFRLQAVLDAPGDFARREVSVTVGNAESAATFGPYSKAQLNDAENPVKIPILAERQAVIIFRQNDFDTSNNVSTKAFSYTVVDRTPPAEALDPVVDTIEEV